MTLESLLAELRRRDVALCAHGAALRCSAPPGVLTAELRDEIRRRKSEILSFLASAETLQRSPRAIVPIAPGGTLTPVFGVPGHNGDVFCYRDFARDLGQDRPFYGLEPPGLDGRSAPLTRIEDLAAFFEDQLVAFRPAGSCILTGYCAGGTVAFELGRRLLRRGRNIVFIALFGSPHPEWYRFPAQVSFRLRREFRALWSAPGGRLRYVTDSMLHFRSRVPAPALDPVLSRRRALEKKTIAAVRGYRLRPFEGRLALFVPDAAWLPSSVASWRAAASESQVYYGPEGCRQDAMLSHHSPAFAALFRRACEDYETPAAFADILRSQAF